MNIELTLDEVNFVLTVLGDTPTKSNAYPLIQKIVGQVQPQLPANAEAEEERE